MRKEFLEVETKGEAEKLAPWASAFCKVVGGWMVFESWTDAKIWWNQK